MTSEQVKGYMFEAVIAALLRKSGYYWDENVNEKDELEGRGSTHQIDAFGLADYSHPFISKIRLLAECKYKTRESVGIDVVRNMVGVLQDITQNYFSKDHEIAEQILFKRYTDAGVIFSNTSFSDPAVSYGFAHNVYLVSYKGNPVMKKIIKAFEEFCSEIKLDSIKTKEEARQLIKKAIDEEVVFVRNYLKNPLKHAFDSNSLTIVLSSLSSLIGDTSSVIAFIDGSYPIHIFSEVTESLADYLTHDPHMDNGVVRVGYNYDWEEGQDTVLFSFKGGTDRKEFYFTLPAQIFKKRRLESRNLISEKEKFLNNIIIPNIQNHRFNQLLLRFDRNLIDR